MIVVLDSLRAEAAKILTTRSTWAILAVLLIGMPLLGVMDGFGIAQVGLGATPETHPELIEPIAPLEFIGTDLMATGQAICAILGAIIGGAEFRHHQVRTTLLAVSRRPVTYVTRLFISGLMMAAASAIAAWATFAATQLGIGSAGLSPLALAPATWRLIGGAILSWTAIGLMSESIALLCRSAIIPILVFVPLGFGLGEMAAGAWSQAEYLPTVLGNALYTSPLHPAAHTAQWSTMGLAVWLIVIAVVSGVVFNARDIGTH